MFGKYEAWIISKAQYDHDGVAFSTVAADFPFEIGPDQLYDTISNLRKPWGRDAATGLPLLVTEITRYTATIAQHGVCSSSADVVPMLHQIPAACIARVQVTNAATLADIDAAAKHFVLGVRVVNSEDALPPALEPYAYDVALPSARWDELRGGMISLGIDADRIDNWRDNHPNATPLDVRNAFRALISQE
jgi:hypothetical protein